MDRRRFVRSATGISVGLLTGCVGGGDGGPEPTGGGSVTAITIPGTAAKPPTLSVTPGTTVTWYNTDSEGHRIRSTTFSAVGTDWSFDSGTLSPGERVDHTFEKPGAYEYYGVDPGVDQLCGVVLVGEVTYDATLPCAGTGGGDGVCCPG